MRSPDALSSSTTGERSGGTLSFGFGFWLLMRAQTHTTQNSNSTQTFVFNFLIGVALDRKGNQAIERDPHRTSVDASTASDTCFDRRKSGSVLISFTKNFPVGFSRNKSTRARPEHSRA